MKEDPYRMVKSTREERIRAVNGPNHHMPVHSNCLMNQTNTYHFYYNQQPNPNSNPLFPLHTPAITKKPNKTEVNKDAIFNYFNGVKEELKKGDYVENNHLR